MRDIFEQAQGIHLTQSRQVREELCGLHNNEWLNKIGPPAWFDEPHNIAGSAGGGGTAERFHWKLQALEWYLEKNLPNSVEAVWRCIICNAKPAMTPTLI